MKVFSMNKILIYILFFFSFNLIGINTLEQLDLAIRNSDLQVVKSILIHQKLSPSEAIRYYLLAKEQSELIKSSRFTSKKTADLGGQAFSYALGTLISTWSILFSSMYAIKELTEHGRFSKPAWVTIALSCITIIICLKKGGKYSKQAAELFNRLLDDSRTIKGLLVERIDPSLLKNIESL